MEYRHTQTISCSDSIFCPCDARLNTVYIISSPLLSQILHGSGNRSFELFLWKSNLFLWISLERPSSVTLQTQDHPLKHRTFQVMVKMSAHQLEKWLCSLTARRNLPVVTEGISCRGTMSYLLCKLRTRVLVLELCPASIIWTVPTFSKRPCLVASKEEEWLHYFDIQNWQTVFLCHLPVSGENRAPLPGFADTFHQQRVCKWAATLKSMP